MRRCGVEKRGPSATNSSDQPSDEVVALGPPDIEVASPSRSARRKRWAGVVRGAGAGSGAGFCSGALLGRVGVWVPSVGVGRSFELHSLWLRLGATLSCGRRRLLKILTGVRQLAVEPKLGLGFATPWCSSRSWTWHWSPFTLASTAVGGTLPPTGWIGCALSASCQKRQQEGCKAALNNQSPKFQRGSRRQFASAIPAQGIARVYEIRLVKRRER